MFLRPPFRSVPFALLLLAASAFASAGHTVTLHNLTDKTLTVSRDWGPGHPGSGDPPQAFQEWSQCLEPGDVPTYFFQSQGKDVETDIVIRHLAADEAVHVEDLTIQSLDLDPSPSGPASHPGLEGATLGFQPIGEKLPPEPEASSQGPNPGPLVQPQ